LTTDEGAISRKLIDMYGLARRVLY